MKPTAKKYCSDQRIVVYSRTEIPTSFASEEEEREWWATHELADELLPDQKEIDRLTGQHHSLIRHLRVGDTEMRRQHLTAKRKRS